jgi:hypothetical protein
MFGVPEHRRYTAVAGWYSIYVMSRITWLAIGIGAVAGGAWTAWRVGNTSTPAGGDTIDQIMAAAELVVLDPKYTELDVNEKPVPLALKRKVLADNAKVFEKVRSALQNPTFRTNRDETDVPKFAAVREFARLVARKEEVEIEEGNDHGAIETLAFGLHLANAMERGALISGLVGMAIESIVLKPVAERLPKLKADDATYLLAKMKGAINRPIDLASMIRGSLESSARRFEDLEGTADRTVETLPSPAKEFGREVREKNRHKPTAKEIAQGKELAAYYRRMAPPVLAEIRKPRWLRKKPPLPPNPPKSADRELFLGSFDVNWMVVGRFDVRMARLRLVATDTAIHLYQIQNSMVPRNLAVLNDRQITIDPMNGKPFVYKRLSKRYLLYSTGENGKDEHGKGDDILAVRR